MRDITVRTGVKPIGALAILLAISTHVATADVVAVVSPANPIVSLSHAEIADIFFGKTSRFPDGRSAVPIDQREGSAVRDEFYEKFTAKSPAQVKAFWSKIIFTGRGRPPRAVANSEEAKKWVADNRHAIAYIERRDADSSVKIVADEPT